MNSDATPPAGAFRARVIAAAEAALKAGGSVGPLELLERMGFLHHVHMEGWRKGLEYYPTLEQWIQVGPEKFERTLTHFAEWVKENGMRPIEATYSRRTPGGVAPLQVSETGDPERERFYRTHYAPADLSDRKTKRLAEKLEKPPDLVVFEKTGEEGKCSECGVELLQGDFLLMEKKMPLCVACADLDHLVFLPSGDMALSRRARKNSQLAAVVVRFSRPRKRYERQGLLVTPEALAQAQAQCESDAPERAQRRAQAVVHRAAEDVDFVEAIARAILERFPGCPAVEARSIAEHTGARGSGRVGRSAAGRALDPLAIERAVIAHIRHRHTNYDELLMQGTDRLDARTLIRAQVAWVMDAWTQG